jgi:carboxypeptidase Q
MTKRFALILWIFIPLGLLWSSEKIDSGTNWKIRREGTDNSQVLYAAHYLADVLGPRLTGSPELKAAGEWAITQLKDWGLQNERLEAWDFGHPGWACEKDAVYVISPYKEHLAAAAIAWTPGTNGAVQAQVVNIIPPERPSRDGLAAYLKTVENSVRGKIVMVGAYKQIPIAFNAIAKRREDSDVRNQFDPAKPAPAPKPPPKPDAVFLSPREIDEQIDAFLLANGALVKVMDAARNQGQLLAWANRAFEPSKTIPGIVIRSEDYGRMSRVLAKGDSIEMQVEIVNTFYPEGKTSYNAIAEIPGTDKKDEVVMMGAHLDSWHAGTGATDNAAGVAVMMEAARILKKVGVKPRRTIRIALWSGEEQGLLGSKAYVKDHFGTFESPRPEYDKLAAYLNLDAGTGRVRAATIFGPTEAAVILEEILKPFEDLGVMGTTAANQRDLGGTDSASFSWAGLTGINMAQDPIEYFTHTWHTNLDTFERILEGDLKQCAIVIAIAAYHLAMRDEMLPKFNKDSMPEPVK